MKTKLLLALTCTLLPLLARAELSGWQKDYDALLKKYVSGGGIRYSAWKANAADMAALDKVIADLGAQKPAGDRNDKLAFYINAYNACMLDLVLEKYPIKSVKDYAPLLGVFTGKHIRVGGEKMSLNHLEKELILKGLGDPRAHFAVNCASQSCPVLIPTAYDGATLDKTLNERGRAFTASPDGARLAKDGKTAQLSMIFKWYADDFKPAGGAVAFINKFRPQPLPADVKVEFQEYDWRLNEAK